MRKLSSNSTCYNLHGVCTIAEDKGRPDPHPGRLGTVNKTILKSHLQSSKRRFWFCLMTAVCRGFSLDYTLGCKLSMWQCTLHWRWFLRNALFEKDCAKHPTQGYALWKLLKWNAANIFGFCSLNGPRPEELKAQGTSAAHGLGVAC